jgi:DNA-binding MarR family transcriptional regulator
MRHRKPPPRVLDGRRERGPSASALRSRAADGREFAKTDYEALAAFRFTLRRFLRFSEEGARAAGITPQQHQLLLAIKGRPGREWASLSDIAEALQVRHHAAVGLVDRSARAGLVRRTPDPDDRRQVRVRLTAKGEAILARLSRRNRSELRALRRALRIPFLEDSAN